ncbi:dephospho-CoA kinase [Candidatus Woesearchaeota archaeon]|nr:dephospho-CoA kinase [Candidatus Woesearchaeota archaeon]
MIIAITGFMGSGKTTAASFFPHSWKRISVDSLGHALLEDPSIVKRLTAAFGNAIITHGKIDRALLAKRAFFNKKTLKKLNVIMHPPLRKKILQEIKKMKKERRNAVLDCALVQELGLGTFIDCTILITAPPLVCATRAKRWSRKEITERIQVQKAFQNPDFMIANTASKNDLKKAVMKIVTHLEHARRQ